MCFNFRFRVEGIPKWSVSGEMASESLWCCFFPKFDIGRIFPNSFLPFSISFTSLFPFIPGARNLTSNNIQNLPADVFSTLTELRLL